MLFCIPTNQTDELLIILTEKLEFLAVQTANLFRVCSLTPLSSQGVRQVPQGQITRRLSHWKYFLTHWTCVERTLSPPLLQTVLTEAVTAQQQNRIRKYILTHFNLKSRGDCFVCLPVLHQWGWLNCVYRVCVCVCGAGLAGNRGRNVFIWRWSVRLGGGIVKGELLNLERPEAICFLLPSSRQEDRYHSFDGACCNKEETGRARPPLISLPQTPVVSGRC